MHRLISRIQSINFNSTLFPSIKALVTLLSILIVTAGIWLIGGYIYKTYLPNAFSLLVISYVLGLRHSIDADHIAAIDNVTRQLMLRGEKPVFVGTFFSLGHSTIVIIATLIIAIASASVEDQLVAFNEKASIFGASVSITFLYIISIINGISIYFIIQDMKSMKHPNHVQSTSEIENIPPNLDINNNQCRSSYIYTNTDYDMNSTFNHSSADTQLHMCNTTELLTTPPVDNSSIDVSPSTNLKHIVPNRNNVSPHTHNDNINDIDLESPRSTECSTKHLISNQENTNLYSTHYNDVNHNMNDNIAITTTTSNTSTTMNTHNPVSENNNLQVNTLQINNDNNTIDDNNNNTTTTNDNNNRNISSVITNNDIVQNTGCFTRFFGKYLFKFIDKSYKMYFVGFLFGLGFDTATEISLLAITTIQSIRGVSTWIILFLPLLFTCGMVLGDTIDGILMLGLYGWSSIDPMKKLYYNLFISFVSLFFALFIASLEVFSLIQELYHISSHSNGFWSMITFLTDDRQIYMMSILLIVACLLGWMVSKLIYNYKYKS